MTLIKRVGIISCRKHYFLKTKKGDMSLGVWLSEARWWLFFPSSVGKQSQLLLQPTEVELGLQVGVEFDKKKLG